MSNPLVARLRHAWNVFRDKPTDAFTPMGQYSNFNPQRMRPIGSERSIITSVQNRIALDVAGYNVQHVRTDEDGNYIATIQSHLRECLTTQANIDQTGRAFIQDVVMSMFDEGVVAIVPVEADFDPVNKGGYEIHSMRTGKIVEWYSYHVRVELYNELSGLRERVLMPKNVVGIIENPLYVIMNEPNSTMRRLIHKLNLLDATDEETSSGKLDLIIQLPYVIKSEARQKQAESRRQAIVDQLTGSKYGIAYTDGTERITQLNRPVENTLLTQVEYLTKMLYNQLGITEDVFSGKADDQAMLNYHNTTVEPIVTAIVDELSRKFLTKTARTQGQAVMGFRNVFRLIPANEIAEMADSLTRNEIVTSNEFRAVLGMRPSNSPNANELRNKNVRLGEGDVAVASPQEVDTSEYDRLMEEAIVGIEQDVSRILEEAANV